MTYSASTLVILKQLYRLHLCHGLSCYINANNHERLQDWIVYAHYSTAPSLYVLVTWNFSWPNVWGAICVGFSHRCTQLVTPGLLIIVWLELQAELVYSTWSVQCLEEILLESCSDADDVADSQCKEEITQKNTSRQSMCYWWFNTNNKHVNALMLHYFSTLHNHTITHI